MSKQVLVPIADAVESFDAMVIVDVLRRAGATVTIAGIRALHTQTVGHIQWEADALLSDCLKKDYDLIVLPGGMPGSEYLRDHKPLRKMLKAQKKSGKWYAAVGRSPAIVLQYHGLLKGLAATCYPSMLNRLKRKSAQRKPVVLDQNCITGQGAATTFEFALKLVEVLYDRSTAVQLAKDLLV